MRLPNDILTPRLRIRTYRLADRDFVLALWGDRENGKYMIDPAAEHRDERYLAAIDEMADEPDGYSLVAELRESGAPVGTCCAFPEADGNWDIGYCIHKAHWRQGLGTEMVSSLIRWIEGQGGRSVTGEVADDNQASVALLRKLGFPPDRQSRYKKWGEETWFDAHWYRLELPHIREVQNAQDPMVAWLMSEDGFSIYGACMYAPTFAEYRSRMEGFLADGAARVFVAVLGDRPVGILVLEGMGPAAEVPGLAVAEDCRHRGVGRRLLQQALTSTDLVGAIARTDEDAVGFYRSCGFATERTVVSYPDGEAVRYTCTWTKGGTDGKDR